MLVLLLVGCLTPESFSKQYAERACEERIACGFEAAEDCETLSDPGFTSCDNLDATTVDECLSDDWCTNGSMSTPDACGELGCL